MSLELKKFNMNQINKDKVVVFIGKRETGKSFLVKDLLYYNQDVPVGTVISGTEGANSFYSKIMPSIFIHGEYKPEIIKNVLKRQRKVISTIQQEKEQIGQSNIDPGAFLILDDCLYDKSWVNNKDVRSLFMNGRHYKIMFIITMQYALGIPPNLRTNIDFTFLLRENLISNRKRLYEQYAGMFPTFDVFCQVMDQCTENFECLVINNNAKSNKIEDQVFWYKAESHEDFQLGAPQFWDFHSKNFNPYHDDSDEEILEKNKRNQQIVNVKKSDY
jgi:hypothetical protein